MRSGAFFLGLAVFGLAAPAAGQSGWTTIGRGELDARADRQVIETDGEAGRYREAMLCIEEHDVRLLNATVRYRDGHSHGARVAGRIAGGACSRMFPLAGRSRQVAAIEVVYDLGSLAGGRAVVELVAR